MAAFPVTVMPAWGMEHFAVTSTNAWRESITVLRMPSVRIRTAVFRVPVLLALTVLTLTAAFSAMILTNVRTALVAQTKTAPIPEAVLAAPAKAGSKRPRRPRCRAQMLTSARGVYVGPKRNA
eukprot:Rmarinus@m.2188